MTRRQAEQIAQERGRSAVYAEDDRAILRVRTAEHVACPYCGRWDVAVMGACEDCDRNDARRNLGDLEEEVVRTIVVDLLTQDGSTVDTVEGRTAEGVERKVLERGWITVPSHAAWLGRTLAQAGARVR